MGCDPARILIVDAGKKPDSSITLHASKNVYPSYYDQAVDYKIVQVPPPDSLAQRKVRFNYGFGLWSPEEVSSFSAGIDSIVFIEKEQKWSLNNFDYINSYLFRQRRGILKNTMKIKMK